MTILIATHGRPTLLGRTLESLAACRLPDSYERLLVVENGSFAGAKSLVEHAPRRLQAQYEHLPLGNKSNALNEALTLISDQSLVVFFDDDVRIHPDALLAYASAGAEHGPGSFFGGPVQLDREREPPNWMLPFLPISVRGYDLVRTRMGPCYQIENCYIGFNWAAFAGDIKRVGGFDVRLGPGSAAGANGEDTDVQRRMVKSGMQGVDVIEAVVHHFVPRERTSLRWILGRHTKNYKKMGILSEEPVLTFAFRFTKQILTALAVGAKGLILRDREKVLFTLFYAARELGYAKGYLWSKRNKK